MSLADLPFLIPMPFLLALSGFFSGSETALFGISWQDRTRLRRTSPTAAKAVVALLSHPRRLLITLLLCNMAVNVSYLVLFSLLLLRAESPTLGIIVNLAGLLALILFGEVLAKMLAASHRVLWCRLLSIPLLTLHTAISPIGRALDAVVIGPLSRLVHPPEAAAGALSLDELNELVALSAREGRIDPEEQTLLEGVLQMGELRVRDIVTPRQDLAWLRTDATPQQVADLVRRTGATHVPVCRTTLDGEIVGMLSTRPYLARAASVGLFSAGASPARSAPSKPQPGAPRPVARPPRMADHLSKVPFVPELARLDGLLSEMRRTGSESAIAVDEHGSVVGAVRIEDIAERLVDELGDPAEDENEAGIERLASGLWRVSGRLSARDWAEVFGNAPVGRAATVAGIIIAQLGRIPKPGDQVTIGNVRLKVDRVSGNAVETVLVSVPDAEAPDAGEEAGA